MVNATKGTKMRTILAIPVAAMLLTAAINAMGSAQAERRCATVDCNEAREALVGYGVKYGYAGLVYRTPSDNCPGERVRVDNRLRPIHF